MRKKTQNKKRKASPPYYRTNEEMRAHAIQERRRKLRRERRIKTFYFLFALTLIVVFVTLSLTVLFPIEQITVTGQSIYPNDDIVRLSGIELGTNIFRIDRHRGEKTIEENLSYVQKATIVRRLPTTVEIQIEPAVAFAAVQVPGQYAIISKDGKVLERTAVYSQDLPVVSGLTVIEAEVGQPLKTEREGEVEAVATLLQALSDHNVQNITGIDFTSLYSISLEIENRITVELGGVSDMEEKIRFIQFLMENDIGPNERGTIDVSMSDRSEARFRPDHSTSSAPVSGETTQSETTADEPTQSESLSSGTAE